jgi:hypothetical protein
MRKSLILSVVAAFLLLAGTPSIPSSAHETLNVQTPTFYRLVPGTYVNGWARFIVHYPKEWLDRPTTVLGEVLRVSSPGPAPGRRILVVPIWGTPVALGAFANVWAGFMKNIANALKF